MDSIRRDVKTISLKYVDDDSDKIRLRNISKQLLSIDGTTLQQFLSVDIISISLSRFIVDALHLSEFNPGDLGLILLVFVPSRVIWWYLFYEA